MVWVFFDLSYFRAGSDGIGSASLTIMLIAECLLFSSSTEVSKVVLPGISTIKVKHIFLSSY